MLDILISSSRKTFPGIPLYIYGHSLGGGIVLDYIIRNNPRISGAIVTSPWLRLSFEPPKIKILLASVMKSIIPGLVQPTGLVVEHISHDMKEVEKYKSDPMVHDKCSVSLFHSAMSAGKYVLEHSGELKIPTLILHGSDDLICSPEGTKEFASKNNLTEIKIFEGGYHELHNELFRSEVFDYIIKWIYKKH
jgi:alpha-beta hydrolase superfamily lysophospholipase